MRAVSPKRAKELREYRKLVGPFLTGRPYCEADCGQPATEVHHKRGRVGALYLDVTWWMALCSSCHRWATENPAAAITAGLSAHRIGRP